MADDRPLLEKLLNMLAADDNTALVAVRKIRTMAEAENKTVGQFCMSPQIIYRDKIVYRDPVPPRGAAREDIREEMRRTRERAERERAANAQQRREREQAERNARRQREYNFDEEPAGTAEERGPYRDRSQRFSGKRELLDSLIWALNNAEEGDLSFYEIDFAQSVPYQVEFDWELSDRQLAVLRRIVAKVKRNKGEAPI